MPPVQPLRLGQVTESRAGSRAVGDERQHLHVAVVGCAAAAAICSAALAPRHVTGPDSFPQFDFDLALAAGRIGDGTLETGPGAAQLSPLG